MSALDPRLEEIRAKYGLQRDDFWELPQKKGTWLVSHKALEMVAVKANITFDMPEIIQANAEAGVAVITVRGFMDQRSEWSFGECSPKNNKNAYPFSMAEKRGKDRVILKLAGLHGLVYSEDEMDQRETDKAYEKKKDGNGFKDSKGYSNGQMNSAGKRRTIDEIVNDMNDVKTHADLDKLKAEWSPTLKQWREDDNEMEVTWRGTALELFEAKRSELNLKFPRSTLEAG